MYTAVHAFWSLKTPSKLLNHIIGAICTLGETTCSLLCLIIYASEPEYHAQSILGDILTPRTLTLKDSGRISENGEFPVI